jgi:thymidylate synthase
MRTAYPLVLDEIRKTGTFVSPRGDDTLEVSGATIVLTSPHDALPTGTGRRLNVSLAVAEFLHLVAGEDDPELLIKVAPHYANFVDPVTGLLRGSYGRRIKDQAEEAVRKLQIDPSTRQASVTCWFPHLDRSPGEHDYPCVISAGWTVRHGHLDAFTEMRSNDAWLGLPGDMFAWTQLQLTIAHILGFPPGTYTHYARSLHLYARDHGKAEDLTQNADPDWEPSFTGLKADSWLEAVTRAKTLLAGVTPTEATAGEKDMRDRIGKHL